ncbi:PREDICTED: plexin domain-containing protein 1-like isoform X2 [Acropora digitifera]|nr:PREDICTED: plexin domain-containing protein 1-like isoform X2 [Acropora digitifera]
MNGSEASCTNGNCTEQINHRYYVSKVISDGQQYWRDIEGHPNSTTHTSLSNRFLGRKKLWLGFKFPYYGHYLDNVVLTTGGFLYMDVHKTSLVTDVQYLAPLMAYFNPSLSVNSTVLTLDDGEQLTVQWRNILLHNKTNVGPFNFQCTLHKNGTIWFAYKQVPVSVDSLPDLKNHPVRVGISDAFVILRRDPVRPIVYRFFFIYSQINITKKSVINGSAVVFYPLPS